MKAIKYRRLKLVPLLLTAAKVKLATKQNAVNTAGQKIPAQPMKHRFYPGFLVSSCRVCLLVANLIPHSQHRSKSILTERRLINPHKA